MEVSAASLLRAALRRSGLSARELSARTGVSEGRISDYLHGRHDPGVRRLLVLLEAAGHTLAVVPAAKAFDRNGLVLPELLDLAEALAVGARSGSPRPAPPRFRDLVATGG